MTIKMRKLDVAINNIIKEELMKGEMPSSDKTTSKINAYISQNDLSAPNLLVRLAQRGLTVSSEDYKKMLDESFNDLSILYSSAIKLNNMATTNLNKYEVERKRLEYQLDKLEKELQELLLLYSDSGAVNSVYDTFSDMSKIDQQLTNANVDITKNEVTIKASRTETTKITPTDWQINFRLYSGLSSVETNIISGTLNNILTQSYDEVWKQEIISSTVQTVGGYVTIDFDTIIVANKILLSLHTVKPTVVKVEFCSDGINWLELPYSTTESVSGNKTYNFPDIGFKSIRFLLSKNENDTTTTVNNIEKYSYIFGIREISFYNFSYMNKSTLVSKPFIVESGSPFVIDKVSLETNSELTTGTWIDYWIALTSNNPNWIPISPTNETSPQYSQVIDFKNVEQATPDIFSFPSNIAISERELRSLKTNNISFYKLGHIVSKQIVNGTEKLYIGKNNWKMEVVKTDMGASHIPSIDDWIDTNPEVSYIKIDSNKSGEVVSGIQSSDCVNYKFTIGVYVQEQNISNAIPICNCPVAIYVNGVLKFSGTPSSSVNYLLNRGWNEIVVLVYKHNTISTISLNLNYELITTGSKFYANSTPLKHVSLFDLQYNIPNSVHDCYAMVDDCIIVLNNYILDVEYEFYYKYITTTDTDSILFKAELRRDSSVTKLSPKLKSYRLKFSI